jgi:hypothetical protein
MNRGLFSKYCIDTSSIIDLRPYQRITFPSLWNEIESLIQQTILISPREVLRELKRQDDIIYKWAKDNEIMFQDINDLEQQEVRDILRKYNDLIDFNKTTPDADPFVIALARHRGCTVVTQEKLRSTGRNKIPNVCKDYDINCIDLLEFFIEQKWSF